MQGDLMTIVGRCSSKGQENQGPGRPPSLGGGGRGRGGGGVGGTAGDPGVVAVSAVSALSGMCLALGLRFAGSADASAHGILKVWLYSVSVSASVPFSVCVPFAVTDKSQGLADCSMAITYGKTYGTVVLRHMWVTFRRCKSLLCLKRVIKP